MLKLVFYVPASHLDAVKAAVFAAGAGRIGEYEQCCWQVLGQGQFKPLENAAPFIGEPDELSQLDEWRVECVLGDAVRFDVLKALRAAHPYEEPAFDFLKIEELVEPSDYYPAKSNVHGMGLFAARDYSEGEVLGFCTVRQAPADGPHVLWAEVGGEERGFEVLCELRFINHSRKANVAYFDDFSVVALRDICADEELLHDYGEGFEADADAQEGDA